MALLGANVQLNDNFQGYYPTRELVFDSGGSTWTSSNVNNELRTDFFHMGPFPVSSPCTFLGYNQELVKQTILKHEAIFKDQIRELHRVYHKQRELMDEIRSELHKQNVRLEASWSSSALSSKHGEKIFYSSNLPWPTSQSSFLFAESIQLPPAFAQEKSRQIFPARASTVTEESLKDYTLPESTCRKVGKKILDLELPADEYIDSDEGEENVQFKLDLNVPFRLEVGTAAKSNNMEAPTNHMNNFLYDLSMRTKFGSQNFHDDVFNKRQNLEGSSHNQLKDNEKKCDWKSSGLNGGLLDSLDKDILTEKQSVSVDSSCKNMEQFDDLSSFHSSHQVNQGPSTKTIFSSTESSARNGFLGATGLPCLKELPVVKGKPNEESTMSTQIESVVLNPHTSSDHGFATKHFQNQAKNQRIEEIEKELPSVDVSDIGEQIPSGEHLITNEKKRKHEYLAGIIDLNSCMIEDENVPIDVDFHAPASPENKECSPPRGESDENQLATVTPFQFAEQEDPHVQEEQTRIAAEALVSISGFVTQKDIQMATCSSSESSANSSLNWFAAIVSTAVDHAENDNETDFNGKVNGLDEFLSDEMDYFEFMTLNLTETKDRDCCFKSTGQTDQIGASASPTQPRKSVRTYRGRWRKDFQSEILPSIASLSRYEVTEDLQIIESLVTADTHSEMGSLRNASGKVPSRGRRRSCSSASNTKDSDLLLNLKPLTNISKLGIEKKGLISWGKTCKKRRGQRFRITNPRFIWS
ncbi:unnamed protein product [Trifolium pratense]|uniref:Uncharacterized protein n=2 Tax=Trifolium pratense TaxID=57577 RepID=A0ACB0L7R6_TRIPR|nr:unnamed protein product [Trifolium pratense]